MFTKPFLACALNAVLVYQNALVEAKSTANLVLMSTMDTSNNLIVNVMREDAGELRLIGSRSTDALGDYEAQMQQYGSRSSFSSSGGMVSDGVKTVVVANTHNNSISLMTMNEDLSLIPTDVASSGGERPCSVALQDELVCALNCGGRATEESSVQCFEITAENKLVMIDSMRAEVSRSPDPAVKVPWRQAPSEIQFAASGQTIIVAGKDISWQTWNINDSSSTLEAVSEVKPFVGENGLASRVYSFNQVGEYLIATATTGNGNPARELTYSFDAATGEITAEPVFALESAGPDDCWSDYKDGYWYSIVPNAGRQSTVESFQVEDDGSLTLAATLNLTETTVFGQGTAAFDAKISKDGKYLYVSEILVENGAQWVVGLGRDVPYQERAAPIGKSFVNIVELGSNGSMKLRGQSKSGDLPLGVTGLTTMNVEYQSDLPI